MEVTGTIMTTIQKLTHSVLALICPPLCPLCSGLTANGGICAACWSGLNLATPMACRQCALPFDHDAGSTICGQCMAESPGFDQAVSGLIYNDTAKSLILALKYGDRLDIAPVLAGLMLSRSRNLIREADVIIPLPLHPKRFFRRRFNQSAEIARHLIHLAGEDETKLGLDLLIRRRNTSSQGRMTRVQRQRNLAGAFAINRMSGVSLKGKSVLLVDDVLTTGASLSAAASCLKKAGAENIAVCVVARVK